MRGGPARPQTRAPRHDFALGAAARDVAGAFERYWHGGLADGDERVAARVLAEFAATREELLTSRPTSSPARTAWRCSASSAPAASRSRR